MIYVNNEDAKQFRCENSAIAIGKFDGIHLGHQLLIEEILKEKENGQNALVFSFGFPKSNSSIKKCIYTEKEKVQYFETLGVDVLLEYPFSKEFSNMLPEEFVKKCLVEQLGVKLVCVGTDFRFGKNRSGDIDKLEELGMKYNFRVIAVEKRKELGDIVSSTRIRETIINDIDQANKLLGKPFFVYGEVVYGKQLGNTIGFPTINQAIDEDKVVPAFGVYASTVVIDGKTYNAVSNLGKKPTIEGKHKVGLETYIFDFSGDLYGKCLETSLLEFVRPEKKFNSIDDLKQQINKDVDFVRNR